MRVIILNDYDSVSEWVFNYISLKINKTKKIVLGLPTGSTPKQVYKKFVEKKINFENVTTFNMDEYIGLPYNHEQSYHYFMNKNLFDHININKSNINIPNGLAEDVKTECKNYENKIQACGGIDLFLCGIGSDGHLAFNEPGSSFTSLTRVKTLTTQTIKDNSRFFEKIDDVPKTAITVGIKTITDSKEILIMASGINKANAIKQLIEGNISTQYPCTIAQMHKNATIIIDNEAASELKFKTIQYYKNIENNTDILGNSINNSLIKKNIYFNEKVLISSPHPDDDVIGMGGIMQLLPNKNNTKIIYLTNGAGGLKDEDNYGPYTRIKEAISSVKILGYNKNQVIYNDFPFYKKKPREITFQDIEILNNTIKTIKPKHIFICCDPDPNNTHILCVNLFKKATMDKNTNIWLYKSAWQNWNECNLKPNIKVYFNDEIFEKKLLAIDMHISQINPMVYKNTKIESFKDIVVNKNKSILYFGKYYEEFYKCNFHEFLDLEDFY